MTYLANIVLSFVILVVCASLCSAQGFSATSGAPPQPSQKGSDAAQTFVSLQGRFTISLPKQVSAYSAISTNVPEGRIEGDTFSWRTAEGLFEVSYIDLPSGLANKAVFDRSRDNKLVLNRKAKLTGEKDISLAGNAGRETKFETPGGIQIVRTYLVGSRMYEASVLLPNSSKTKEEAAVRALDSLKLLSQAEVDVARRKEASEATPSLPQGKATPKLKSDAEDEGIKGRVKTVFRETEDVSGTQAVGKRKPSSMDYYEEKGQLTKYEGYDYKGNLFQVTAYGYVDGQRASSDEFIHHEYDPPPVMITTAPGQPKETYDPRYHYKYAYKYDYKGRLVEKVLWSNNGKVWLRYVYNYNGNRKETLGYSEDGSLNQKSVQTLDAQGNELDISYYDEETDKVSERYSHTYDSFDGKGNWTKRTTLKWVLKDGKEQFVPDYVTYRTITYY